MFEKYVPYVKNFIHKIVLLYNLTWVPEKMVQIGSSVIEIQNVGENECSILYNINLFENYEQF